ncbi:MAG: pseudouridine synthase, partial [Lachnospiraceae bacterium]|nr:pseudouridine synthase [Lachnospiraceae bacterium]
YIDYPRKAELFPVGRLDLDTEGLLLLTNDGAQAHRMLSPRHHVEKTYFARVRGRLAEADVESFAEGMDIGEKRLTLPAKLHILEPVQTEAISEAEVTLCEGKFHQVRRMFAARGCEVLYLKRISMAGLTLDETLAPGSWRELTEEETERLYTYAEAD